MKNLRWVLLLFLLVNLSSVRVFAQSDYVLPYPSQMPGNKFYTINQVIEKVSYFWYFGSFGQFKYNLKKADKYLVEAKTLFEYKQFLLGYQALKKSDGHFKETLPKLINAR